MCGISSMHIYMRCKTPDLPIAVFIQWKPNLQVGLCKNCWERFCDSKKDYEWGDETKIEDFQKWLESGRGLQNTIEMEYRPYERGTKKYKSLGQMEDEEHQLSLRAQRIEKIKTKHL